MSQAGTVGYLHAGHRLAEEEYAGWTDPTRKRPSSMFLRYFPISRPLRSATQRM